jgi:hypothetical protein
VRSALFTRRIQRPNPRYQRRLFGCSGHAHTTRRCAGWYVVYLTRITRDAHALLAWSGLDTLILTAGVSALQPLMSVAGIDMSAPGPRSQANAEGIQHAVKAANAAVNGNFIGPYVVAITFVRRLIIGVEDTLIDPLIRSPSLQVLPHHRLSCCFPA